MFSSTVYFVSRADPKDKSKFYTLGAILPKVACILP